MKQLTRILIAALVAAAIATIVVQRDQLRQIDRAELAAQMRHAVESMKGRRSRAIEESIADAIEDPAATSAAEAVDEAVDEATDAATDATTKK